MRRAARRAGALLLAALLPLGGCADLGWRKPQPDPVATAGAGFVARACAGCHAVGTSGAPRDPAAPNFRSLVARRSDSELQLAVSRVAQHGHVQMPPIYMTDDEQAAVLAYFRSLRRQTLPHA
ncbi:c-type cytochrome [Caulobacter sp. KR2-114]|uniref:c-type cytochrome n=1 Tax=Caulobacter sp. KR2-114 TaxID=3400912 RepID=UPI003C0EB43C